MSITMKKKYLIWSIKLLRIVMVQNILSKVPFSSGFKLVKFKHSDVYTEFIP